jgi:hypothetical protein
MADDATQTADGAVRLYLATVGTTLIANAIPMIAEKDGNRFIIGWALLAAALPVFLGSVFWRAAKARLGAGIVMKVNTLATSPGWWLACVFVLVAGLVFTPVVQQPRMPSWPLSRVELTTVPTTLRLQFNESGAKPEQIDSHNVEWAWTTIEGQRPGEPSKKYVCDRSSIQSGISGSGTISTVPSLSFNTPRCEDVDFPRYVSIRKWVIFLTFLKPISAKNIRLNSHGAPLPKSETGALTERLGYISFDSDLTRMILDFEVVN